MIRVKKTMFPAEIAFWEVIFAKIIQSINSTLHNRKWGVYDKKILVLMLALVMTLSLAACGGESTTAENTPASSDPNTEKSIDLVEVTGNGLSFMLPADIKLAKTDETTVSMLFTNDENTVVITLSVLIEEPVISADMTDDVLSVAVTAGSGLSDGSFERSLTLEHDDGSTSVIGFGKGTLSNGMAMNSVLQYFFPADGGYLLLHLADNNSKTC